MNRRTVLQSAGALGAIGVAGCLGDIGIESPVPIELYNEASRSFNVHLEAHERGGDRQTYDESIAMTPGEQAIPGPLERLEQRIRVVRYGDDEHDDLVETATVTTDTLAVVVSIYDDALELEVNDDQDEAADDAD